MNGIGNARRGRAGAILLLGLVLVVPALAGACDEVASSGVAPRVDGESLTPGTTGGGGSDDRVAPLIGALGTGTRTERAAAAWELGDIGDTAAIPALIEALADESWDVREAVVAALTSMPDARSVEPLLALIAVEPAPPVVRDEDLGTARRVCDAAISALGTIGDARAAGRLVAIAVDEDSDLDREGARTTVAAMGEAAVPAVTAALKAAPVAKAPALVALLGHLGDAALEPLLAALGDRRDAVRVAAAAELGAFGDDAYRPLLAALRGKGDAIRSAAARSLGEIGDPRATSALVDLLGDGGTRRAAVAALVAIHRDDATPLLRYLRKAATVAVYRPLIRIGQSNTVPELVDALDRFGSKQMGENYLNCGEPRLEKAAKRWGARHGYIVVPSVGAGEEGWGVH